MAKIISTVNYPVKVKYDGATIVVSPNEALSIKKPELLPGSLPTGLILINK